MVQAQLQELEQAKQLIGKQKLEIQKLKEDQYKANKNYSNILAMMNDRLQEQDSEAANMNQEVSEMIINQQNTQSQCKTCTTE
jgi:glucose-6-phosphate isomerase